MGLGSLVGGLINSGRSLPTVDVRPLLDTINGAGKYQKDLINGMPEAIRKQLADYAASLGEAGGQYKSAIQGLTDSLQQKASSIYGPDSEAAKLAMGAAKTQTYSTVPGTQNAIRNALASTGGLSRGHAGSALAQPYMQAATDYSKAASGIASDQAAKGQQAQMDALKAATTMEDTMFQNLFGMSKDQAKSILTSGNQALSDQLAALINQSANQTGQTLSAQGIQVNNGYQNAVTRNSQQNAITQGLVNAGVDAASNFVLPGGGGASGAFEGLF